MNAPINYQVVMIEVRSVYGVAKLYPANDAARTFAEIAGTKTLSPSVVRQIQSLGYEIVSIADADWRRAA